MTDPAAGEYAFLKQNEAAVLTARVTHRIACEAGRLWVTQDGNPRDYVLEAGECVTFRPRSRIVIFALEAARYRVLAPRQTLAAVSPGTRFFQKFGAALRGMN